MKDDVKARFAAVRVSYQQGHIPCRSARFTSSCARETNQPAVRMSLKSVCWVEYLTSSSSKGIPPRIALPPRVRKNPPCQPAPQTGAGLQKKPRARVRVVGTFQKSLQGLPASHVLRIFTGGQDTGHHQHVGTFHKSPERKRPPCLETFRHVLPENRRCVVRVRSAWRCATPCCLPALPNEVAFTVIFTSSEDLPEKSVALVPWLWAEPVRTSV